MNRGASPMHRRLLLRALASLPLGTLASTFAAPTHAADALRIAVVPQFPAQTIAANWTPLLEAISTIANVRLELKYYKSISEFETGFRNGEPDLVYLNPYHMIMAAPHGYTPLIRDARHSLSGILVVKQESPAHDPKDLNGAKIAFPSPNAFGASLYMRALLTREFRIGFEPIYRGTHSNVFRHVLAGFADAGGAIRSTYDAEPAEVRDRLRILFETPSTPSHPIAIHSRIPPAVSARILSAFTTLGQSANGKALVEKVRLFEPVPARFADYVPLEKLHLEQFVVDQSD